MLQVLSFISKRGREIGGPTAQLADLAATQETALRRLIADVDVDTGSECGTADLAALFRKRSTEQFDEFMGKHGQYFPDNPQSTEELVEALHEAVPIRRCTTRISARTPPGGACALAEMGRCVAPCTGSVDVDEYRAVVDDIVTVMAGDASSVVEALTARMAELAASERFEEAATVRDRTLALVRGASRAQRIAPLAASPELVAARRLPAGGWEAICVRHGRFAASVSVRPGVDPVPAIDAMRATAEVVPVPDTVLGATIPEETDILLRWLEQPGVRLVHLDGVWDCPVGGAQSAWARLEPVAQSARGAVGFAS